MVLHDPGRRCAVNPTLEIMHEALEGPAVEQTTKNRAMSWTRRGNEQPPRKFDAAVVTRASRDGRAVQRVAEQIRRGESALSNGSFVRVDRSNRFSDPSLHRDSGYEWESEPTLIEITARAYQIYAERAGGPGEFEDDWLCAEQELLADFGLASLIRPAAHSDPAPGCTPTRTSTIDHGFNPSVVQRIVHAIAACGHELTAIRRR